MVQEANIGDLQTNVADLAHYINQIPDAPVLEGISPEIAKVIRETLWQQVAAARSTMNRILMASERIARRG